jgi:hypothetical protein
VKIKCVRQIALIDITRELRRCQKRTQYAIDGVRYFEYWNLNAKDVFSKKQTKLNKLLKINVLNYQKK